MKKVFKWIIFIFAFLFLMVIILLNTPSFQRYIAEKITDIVNKNTKAVFSVGQLKMSFPLCFDLQDVLVKDHKDSTILKAEAIKVRVADINPIKQLIRLRNIKLKALEFNLIKYKGDESLNIMYLIPESEDTTSSSPSWDIQLNDIEIVKSRFVYEDRDEPKVLERGEVDYFHLDIRDLNTEVSSFRLDENMDMFFNIKTLSLKEKSGFEIEDMSTNLMLGPNGWLSDYFRIKTPTSDVAFELKFDYKGYDELADFIEKVNISAFFDRSEVSTNDLSYFAPELGGLSNSVLVDGAFFGTIDDFKTKDIFIRFGQETVLSGDVRMKGLPDLEKLYIDADIDQLYVLQNDVRKISFNHQSISIPSYFKDVTTATIKGKMKGTLSDFELQTDIQTNVGAITGEGVVKELDSGLLSYDGTVNCTDFALGSVLQQDDFGKVDMDATIKGQGVELKDMDLSLDAVVGKLDYRGRRYHDISVKGGVKNQRFDALVDLDNQLGAVNLEAAMDLAEDTVIHVHSSLRNFDLAGLQFFELNDASRINVDVDASIESLDIDRLSGYAKLLNFEYVDDVDSYHIDSLIVNVDQQSPEKSIMLQSEILDMDMKGQFKLSAISEDLQVMAKQYMPAVITGSVRRQYHQQFYCDLKIKETDQINRLLHPLFKLSNQTSLKAKIGNSVNDLDLMLHADSLWVSGFKMNDLSVVSDAQEEGLNIQLKTRDFELNRSDENKGLNIILDSLQVNLQALSNEVQYDVRWGDAVKDSVSRGYIAGLFAMNSLDSFTNKIQNMEVMLSDSSVWDMDAQNRFAYEDGKLIFDNIALHHQTQKIAVDGVVSSNQEDVLQLEIENLKAMAFNGLLKYYATQIDGVIHGKMYFKDLSHIPQFIGNLTIDDLVINEEKLGTLSVNSKWNGEEERLALDSKIVYTGNVGSSEKLNIGGYYYPTTPQGKDSLDFDVKLSNLTLKVLQPFLVGNVSDLSGWVSGNLAVTGSSDQLNTEGMFKFLRAGLKVDFLGTKYYFSDQLRIAPNEIVMDNFPVFDNLGNEALVNGKITHRNFDDIFLDIRLSHKKFHVLNTKEEDNSLFYGKAFADGTTTVKGKLDDIRLDIEASPTKNTKVVIPINATYSVIKSDFITFINPNDTLEGVQKKAIKQPEEVVLDSGFDLGIELNLNPQAEASIILPFQMGRIDGKGSGDIRMDVTSDGQFNMFGKYFIDEGVFDLNVQNILSNTFSISRGSYIAWTGNPYDADVNVRAVYLAKPSLANLPAAQSISPEIASERLPVECIVKLSNKLFNPTIDFSINIPSADNKLKEIIYSSIDTTNVAEMNKQMIYLLLLNSFHVSGYETNVDLELGAQSLELLSAQVSSWLSQVSDDFDIGINYRSQGEKRSEEIEVALSTKLFNDRVLVSGNFGVINGQETVNNANTIVGDVLVEVKITDDGRFRVKAFNRTNNINLLEEESPYTQGIGIFYRKEFDYFSELFRRKRKRDLKK